MKHIDIKGARVPALGLGTWQLTGRTCSEAVRQALELGYRHIDTAQMYGNEIEVGRGLRDSGVARAEIFLTTKLAPGNLSAALVRRTAEESLKRLAVEQVDLLLIHWPAARRRWARRWQRSPSCASRARRASSASAISPSSCSRRRSRRWAPTSCAIRSNTIPSCRSAR